MSGWKQKRFWQTAEAVEDTSGYAVNLDGRPIKTPGRSSLVMPTRALAEAIAEEWSECGDVVDPGRMPLTRMANSAIEKVLPQKDAVAGHLLAYGETDLLCYRAEGPDALVRRQCDVWDPWLSWLESEFGVSFNVTAGVIPVAQDARAFEVLADEIRTFDHFELTAFHDLVTLTGSLVLGLAAIRGAGTPEELWQAACLDETWQIEQWGEDDEATVAERRKAGTFNDAVRFLALARQG